MSSLVYFPRNGNIQKHKHKITFGKLMLWVLTAVYSMIEKENDKYN